MESVTLAALQSFLQELGERYTGQATLYLLGGCALGLLGNPRTTVDIDYTFEIESEDLESFQEALAELAVEMRIDVDEVPIAEFVPLPPHARERRRLVGRYGDLDVYIFDLYTIALSKIARGFEADLEDVLFLLQEDLIDFGKLERHFHTILPEAPKADIVPGEFLEYFEEIRKRFSQAQ